MDETTRLMAFLDVDRIQELARLEYSQNNLDKAKTYFTECLRIAQKHEYRIGEARALSGLAASFRGSENGTKSINLFEQALVIAREEENHILEATVLGNLGNAHLSIGNHRRARELLTRALAIHREQGNHRMEAFVLCSIGSILMDEGLREQSHVLLHQALDICQSVGDKKNEAMILANIAHNHHYQNDHKNAQKSWMQAIRIFESIENFDTAGIHWGNLGDSLIETGQFQEAERALKRGIERCEKSIPGACSAFRGSLARLLAERGEFNKAQSLLDQSEQSIQVRPREHAIFLCKKGHVLRLKGDIKGAREALKQAQVLVGNSISDKTGLVSRAINTLCTALAIIPAEN